MRATNSEEAPDGTSRFPLTSASETPGESAFEENGSTREKLGTPFAEDVDVPSSDKTVSGRVVRNRKLQDLRIDSLKVLALSLLHEIERFEKEAGGGTANGLDLQNEVRRFEAELIHSALVRTGGRQRRAARLLGMKVTTLNTKIKRYRLNVDYACQLKETELHADAPAGSD